MVARSRQAGRLPGVVSPLDLDRVPARSDRFDKADWAPRVRNPIFVWHTSAAECKQKWRPRKLNSGWLAGWLPDLFTSSPAVLSLLRFVCCKTLKKLWFLYVSNEKTNKTIGFSCFSYVILFELVEDVRFGGFGAMRSVEKY